MSTGSLTGVGKRIAEERKRLGLSQAAFAQKVGVSLSSQKRYESGERVPDSSYLEWIILFGIDISYLLTGSRQKGSDNFIDEFNSVLFMPAFLAFNKITTDDLKSIVKTAEAIASDPVNVMLSPDESLKIYETKITELTTEFLEIRSKSLADTELLEIDISKLALILEALDLRIEELGKTITSVKKAQVAAILYRSLKNNTIEKDLLDQTIELAST